MVACGSPGGNTVIITENDDQIIQEIVTNLLPSAYSEQDTSVLNILLHTSYRLIDDNGDVYTKTDELTYAASYGPSYSEFDYAVQQVELFPSGTGLVLGKCTLKGSNDDGSVYVTTYTSSDVLVKEGGKWQVIHGHVSGVKEEVYPAAPEG